MKPFPERILVKISESRVNGTGAREEIALGESLRELADRRSVRRGRWGGHSVVVKRYLPHRKQKRHSSLEWSNLNRLRSLGLKAPEPLFFGRDDVGAAVVVMRELQEVRNLETLLETAPELEREKMLKHLFEAIAQQHNAGAFQEDIHLRNFIWSPEGLFPVDAGSFQFRSRPLRVPLRARNFAWLFVHAGLTLEKELWQALPAYLEKAEGFRSPALFQKSVRQRIPVFRRQFSRSCLKKTTRSCTAFKKEILPGKILFCDRHLPLPLKEAFANTPDQLVQGGRLLKAGNTCTVAEVTFNDELYIIKRYNRKPPLYRFRHAFQQSRSRRSWSVGLVLRILGLPTPMPVGCLEERSGPILLRSFLLMEKDKGTPINQFVAEHKDDPESIHEVARDFSLLWEAMGSIQASHGNMKATNLLVSKEHQISFIDLDSFRFFSLPLLYRRKRKKDFDRFMKNWETGSRAETYFRNSIAP